MDSIQQIGNASARIWFAVLHHTEKNDIIFFCPPKNASKKKIEKHNDSIIICMVGWWFFDDGILLNEKDSTSTDKMCADIWNLLTFSVFRVWWSRPGFGHWTSLWYFIKYEYGVRMATRTIHINIQHINEMRCY